jgi:hypothetical protein
MNTGLPAILCVVVLSSLTCRAQGQTPAEQTERTAASPTMDKEQLLASPRWRAIERSFDNWLSVQDIYTPAEMTQMKQQLQNRVRKMSAAELEDFMADSEERLKVLLSDQATEARSWLSFLTPQARRRMIAPQGNIPDVFSITVSQLRQELNQFQQQRSSMAAAQAGFNQSRERQVQNFQADQRAQQQQMAQLRNQAPSFGTAVPPVSPYSPVFRREYVAPRWPPVYVTPWGGLGWRAWPY